VAYFEKRKGNQMFTRTQIDETVETLSELRASYLRQQGWEYQCNTPDSCWYWQKTLEDGRTAIVSETTALGIEAYLSSDNETQTSK
jgi:hypothetical protein